MAIRFAKLTLAADCWKNCCAKDWEGSRTRERDFRKAPITACQPGPWERRRQGRPGDVMPLSICECGICEYSYRHLEKRKVWMPKFRGMWSVCLVACLGAFLPMYGVRADSILDAQAPNGGQKELVEWNPVISFTRDPASTGSTEAYGTFSISISSYGGTGTLTDSSYSGGSSQIFSYLGYTPFTISGTMDVKLVSPNTYQVTFGGTTVMDLQGYDLGSTVTPTPIINFNQSNDLSAFAINLDGTTGDPLAAMFAIGSFSYYSGSNETYVIAQLKKIATSSGTSGTSSYVPNDPLVGSDFFVTSGSTVNWDPNQYKLDVFAVSLPLPAPFWCGILMLGAFTSAAILAKKWHRA